jgi:hypothetical protein
VQHGHGGSDGRHGGEGPHVSDAADERRAQIAAGDEPQKVGRHHDAGHRIGKSLDASANPEQREEKADADQQEAGAEEQGKDGSEHF